MTVMPQTFCEIAFTKDSAGYPLWQDVSDYVEWEKGVRISRRRSHELDEVQPGTLSLSLINTDGRFTAGRTSSPYYPNVTLNRPIRIRARWQGSVNMLLKGQAEATDTGLFSTNNGTLATSATAPAGQTSSIRWSSASWVSGDILRIGANGTTTPTDEGLYVVGGATYSIRCQARRETNTVSVAIRVRWFDKDGAVISDVFGSSVALTTSFQAVSYSPAAPANAVFARVFLATQSTATSAAILSSAWQVEKAAAPTSWVTPGEEYSRYVGYIDRWPHGWTNGVLGYVSITATDRMKLLGRDTIRGAVIEETLLTGPVCYYPLAEQQSATQGGNLAVTSQPDITIQQAGVGGTAAFGQEGGPDESTAVVLTPASTANGKLLSASPLYTPVGGGTGLSLAAWVNFGSPSLAGENRVLYVDNGPNSVHVRVNYNTTSNTLTIGIRTEVQTFVASTSSFNLDDAALHLVVVTLQLTGGNALIKCYIDGALAINSSTATALTAWPSLSRLSAGGLLGTALDPPELMQGLISGVAGWNSTLTSTQVNSIYDAQDGFAGELSGVRTARIAAWAGIQETDVDAGASTMDRHPGGQQSPLAALKLVALSEGGLFFMSRAGVATFRDRTRRQLLSSTSIPLTADQCGPDLSFVMDDTLLINDVSVNRSGQTAARVTDLSSINTHGSYTASIDTLLHIDIEAFDRASYIASSYGDPQPRAGQISIDAHALSMWPQILGSEIGQRIEITALPSEAPDTVVNLWCEGVEDQITDSTWRFTFDTSPASTTVSFTLDDAVYGTLDNNKLGW